MKACPVGAIVRAAELSVLQAALEEAVEAVQSDRRARLVPNPRLRDTDDLENMRAWDRKLALYGKLRRDIRRCLVGRERRVDA